MIRRALSSFSVQHQPPMTRQAYHHELVTACTMPVAIAMIEGGIVGVLSKTIFQVSDLGFAAIYAAPMFANLTSLLWTRLAKGKAKSRSLGLVMSALLILVGSVALLPTTAWGPAALVAIVIAGRCLIAGTLTIRSIIWRANYPRNIRARIIGRFVLIASLILATVPILVGRLLDFEPSLFRLIYPAAACVGIVGAIAVFKVRVRGEPALIRSERSPHDDPDIPLQPSGRPHNFISILKQDGQFRTYMIWQFVAGVANMAGNTAIALFIVNAIAHRDDANSLGMLLNATVPLALATATVPLWSRLLDRQHIARYRVSHGLTWIFGQAFAYLAATLAWIPLFFLPQATYGVMRGGGMIAWQLGHNDFADRRLTALYMGIHQTLTGVRGLFAPFLGTALLTGWNGITLDGQTLLPAWQGIGPNVFLITTALSLTAWLGFLRLSQQLKHIGQDHASDG
jgi:hypothetical protein